MTQIDARKLSVEELFQLRQRIVGMLNDGNTVKRIAQECGVSWDAVNAAIKLYQQGGIEALRPKPRGRKLRTGRLLTPEQERSIRHSLYTKKPYQLGQENPDGNFTVNLWSRERVRQYIQKECGISLSTACLSLYLDRWELRLNPKDIPPLERCTPEIQQWLNENYVGNRDYDLFQTYWITRKTITAEINDPWRGRRMKRLSVVTAINGKSKGDDYWGVYQGNFTKERQNGFMKFLWLQSDRKVLLIRTSWEHFTHLKVERFRRTYQHRIHIIPPMLPGEREKLYDQQLDIESARSARTDRM